MSEPKPTTLVAPDGRRYDVPPGGVERLKARGWRDLNDAERTDAAMQAKYGTGVLPALGAAVSGAASTLTFGASDLAAQAIGGEVAEANRELAERQPGARTFGEVASIAVPLLGEVGALGKGAQVAKTAGAAVTGVSKGAQALGSGAAAVAKSVGLEAAAPIIRAATQGAVEGAAFQVGHNVGEAARRDAKLDAETLLAHVGEAAYMAGGISAAIPVAGKITRWSANKALAGLEQGAQGLRALGFGVARAGVDVVDDLAGIAGRNADNIGSAVATGAKGAAGVFDDAAGAVVRRADDIGGAVAGASKKIGDLSDDVLLPRIRKGLTEQTGRPDIIDDVFQPGAAGRELRQKLGSETITGTREVQAEALGESLNKIWSQSLDNAPMFDDLALAAKKELQAAELAGSSMSKKTQAEIMRRIAGEAGDTLNELAKFNKDAHTIFADAVKEFQRSAVKRPSPQAIYEGLDALKVATDRIAQWSKGATGDMSIGAAASADAARKFRGFAKDLLEDATAWGAAGVTQQQVNAAYSKYRRAADAFEKQFAAAKAKGTPQRVLDGAKIKKFARDITGQPGSVRNAVIDDLIEAQTELIELTDQIAKRAQTTSLTVLQRGAASPQALARAADVVNAPEVAGDVLARGRSAIDDLSRTRDAARKAIDRAEVLQETQSAILSRQGAGVNPLPVDLAQKIGAGALVGGAIGGMPGAIVGGSLTSVLQKYGAVTSNPKSALELLNTIDRLRGADKERVASWLKSTLGEASDKGLRGKVSRIASEVDGKRIAASVRRGAEAVQERAPAARAAIERGNKDVARRLLAARVSGERGLATLAARMDAALPNAMRRLLPTVSYAGVSDSDPTEWWSRTQKALVAAQADPQALLERIEKDLEPISGQLPDTASAILEQQLRVVGYLADRMPRNPRPMELGREWKPSREQLSAFRDLTLVATKPDALLPLISMGTATQEQVDAVRTLWPAKFADITGMVQQAVIDAAANGTPVPYKSRLRLGQLLGVPLDSSQEPGFAQWIDATSTQPGQEEAGTSRSLGIDTDRDLPMSARAANRK